MRADDIGPCMNKRICVTRLPYSDNILIGFLSGIAEAGIIKPGFGNK